MVTSAFIIFGFGVIVGAAIMVVVILTLTDA